MEVTARVAGLRTGTVRLRATQARDTVRTVPTDFGPDRPAPVDHPHADASCSGRPDTLPAAMLDGDPATGWSNAFSKSATSLLPAFAGARAQDGVSVDFGRTRTVDRLTVSFTPTPRTRCRPRPRWRCGTAGRTRR